MGRQEDGERLASIAPPLNDGEAEAINALFSAYLFRKNSTGELWSSCCHEHATEAWDDERMRVAMRTEHQREPRQKWERMKPNAICPFCGRPVAVKDLQRAGGRKNLTSYRRAVILRWYRGALWARAYDCSKH